MTDAAHAIAQHVVHERTLFAGGHPAEGDSLLEEVRLVFERSDDDQGRFVLNLIEAIDLRRTPTPPPYAGGVTGSPATAMAPADHPDPEDELVTVLAQTLRPHLVDQATARQLTRHLRPAADA
jgi:hypothetical protein